MSVYNVYPSWVRRFEKDNKMKIDDLLSTAYGRMQVEITNRKIILQEKHFFQHGKALFVNSIEEFKAIERLRCERVAFESLIAEDLDLVIACPIESGIAPYIVRIAMVEDIEQEYDKLFHIKEPRQQQEPQRYCTIVTFCKGEKKNQNYYLQYNFPLKELNEHINNGIPMTDSGSFNITKDDEEMERRIMTFTAKLLMFMKAAPELFHKGLPQIMLQHTKLMEGRPKVTFRLPPEDWKNTHYRRMHVRQLWASRYYQGEYAHMKTGERMVMVKATVVKRAVSDENRTEL